MLLYHLPFMDKGNCFHFSSLLVSGNIRVIVTSWSWDAVLQPADSWAWDCKERGKNRIREVPPKWWRLKHGTHWTLELPHLEHSWNCSVAQRKEFWHRCPKNYLPRIATFVQTDTSLPHLSHHLEISLWFFSEKRPPPTVLNLVKALLQSLPRKPNCNIYLTSPRRKVDALQHLPSWLNGAASNCVCPETICSSTGQEERWSNEIVYQ